MVTQHFRLKGYGLAVLLRVWENRTSNASARVLLITTRLGHLDSKTERRASSEMSVFSLPGTRPRCQSVTRAVPRLWGNLRTAECPGGSYPDSAHETRSAAHVFFAVSIR